MCVRVQGTHTYGNGAKYSGEWKNGKHHGQVAPTTTARVSQRALPDIFHILMRQGTLTFANGDKYEGEWTDGKKNGQVAPASTRSNGQSQPRSSRCAATASFSHAVCRGT